MCVLHPPSLQKPLPHIFPAICDFFLWSPFTKCDSVPNTNIDTLFAQYEHVRIWVF